MKNSISHKIETRHWNSNPLFERWNLVGIGTKRSFAATLLGSVLLISHLYPAHAAFPGFYPKLSGSHMQFNLNAPEGFILDTAIPAAHFSLSYHPNQSWSVEVGVIQLLSTQDLSPILSKGILDITYKSILPLSRRLEFYIPIGAMRVESSGNFYWAPKFGLGASGSITPNISIEFNWISTYFLKIPFFSSLNYPFSGNIESYSIGVGIYLG